MKETEHKRDETCESRRKGLRIMVSYIYILAYKHRCRSDRLTPIRRSVSSSTAWLRWFISKISGPSLAWVYAGDFLSLRNGLGLCVDVRGSELCVELEFLRF